MRQVIARLLALAGAVCFFSSFGLIFADLGAIIAALLLFVGSLFLGVFAYAVAFSGTPLPPQYTHPSMSPNSTQPTPPPDHEYRSHAATRDFECESCGRDIDKGDRYFVLWAYDDILGYSSDTDAPRLCEHCTSIREHADVLGINGVNEAYARGIIPDEDNRDAMLDYLLAQGRG